MEKIKAFLGSKKTRSRLKLLLKIAVTSLLLYLVWFKIDLQEVKKELLNLPFLPIVAAALFFVLSKIIGAFRLNRFLNQVPLNVSDTLNLKLYALGMYYNLFLPGGIGGDGYKMYWLKKRFDAPLKTVFWALLIDRLSGLCALFALAVGCSVFVFQEYGFNYWQLLLIPLAYATFFIFIKLVFARFQRVYLSTSLLSLGVQISQLVCVYFIVSALQIFKDIAEYLFTFLVSSLVAVLPITIGGLGARELVFVELGDILSLQSEKAVTVSFLFYIITVLTSVLGIYFVWRPLEGEIKGNN